MKGSSRSHLAPELLLRHAQEELSEGVQSQRVQEHLAECGICQAELEQVRRFARQPVGMSLGETSRRLQEAFAHRLGASENPGAERSRKVGPSPRSRRRRSWSAAALVAASVALVALGITRFQEEDDLTGLGTGLRTGTMEQAFPVQVEISPSGIHRVSWATPEVEGETLVRLYDVQGRLLLAQQVAGTSFVFTTEQLAELQPSGPVFVKVEVPSDGRRIESPPVALRP